MKVLACRHRLRALQARGEVLPRQMPMPQPEELVVRQLPELDLRQAEIVPRDRERVVPIEPDRLYWTVALAAAFGAPKACSMNFG